MDAGNIIGDVCNMQLSMIKGGTLNNLLKELPPRWEKCADNDSMVDKH